MKGNDQISAGVQEVLRQPDNGAGERCLQGLRPLRRQPARLRRVLQTHEQQVPRDNFIIGSFYTYNISLSKICAPFKIEKQFGKFYTSQKVLHARDKKKKAKREEERKKKEEEKRAKHQKERRRRRSSLDEDEAKEARKQLYSI